MLGISLLDLVPPRKDDLMLAPYYLAFEVYYTCEALDSTLSLRDAGCVIRWRLGEELVVKLFYLGEILFTKLVRLFCF